MSDESPGPLEFYDQIQRLIRQQRDEATSSDNEVDAASERLILNRAAVRLVSQALGAAQLPAVVLLGQPGHVGFVDGCRIYYDPRLDRDSDPVARYVVNDEDGAS